MLELAPETESNIRYYAEREGLSVDELMARTFRQRSQPQPETPEQTTHRVQGLLAEWQARDPLPVPPGGFKSLTELSAEWAAEDERLTDAEREADRQFWEEFNSRDRAPVQI